MLAIILSILFPGVGQIYSGKIWRGLAMLGLGLTPLYPLALLWSVLDAIRLKKQSVRPVVEKKDVVWVIVACVVIIPLCFAVMIWGGSVFFEKMGEYNKVRHTRKDGSEIVLAIEKHRGEYGTFPNSINDLIGSVPFRYGWRTDAWGNPYIYEIIDQGKNFRLLSMGKDGKAGTADDMVFKQ